MFSAPRTLIRATRSITSLIRSRRLTCPFAPSRLGQHARARSSQTRTAFPALKHPHGTLGPCKIERLLRGAHEVGGSCVEVGDAGQPHRPRCRQAAVGGLGRAVALLSSLGSPTDPTPHLPEWSSPIHTSTTTDWSIRSTPVFLSSSVRKPPRSWRPPSSSHPQGFTSTRRATCPIAFQLELGDVYSHSVPYGPHRVRRRTRLLVEADRPSALLLRRHRGHGRKGTFVRESPSPSTSPCRRAAL